MKRLILISLVLMLGITLNAQKYYYPASNDTIKGDTNYVPSSSGYDLRNIESGALSFTFTHADVADSLSFARIEWSNDGSTWTAYTGNAALSNTTTDGTDRIYISTPLIDRYVRVGLACASGDIVAVTSQILMLKED